MMRAQKGRRAFEVNVWDVQIKKKAKAQRDRWAGPCSENGTQRGMYKRKEKEERQRGSSLNKSTHTRKHTHAHTRTRDKKTPERNKHEFDVAASAA